jgi:lipoprotein-anchoring transpeptidase ErfK/SrfK
LAAASSKRRSRGGDVLAVLLLLACLAGGGWLWWQEKHSPPAAKSRSTEAVSTPSHPVHQVTPSLVLVERKPEPADQLPLPAPAAPVASNTPVVPVPAPEPIAPPPAPPPPPAPEYPRPVRDVFEAQIALARQVISPGALDGAIGSQTRAALMVFQRLHGLAPSRALDTNTAAALKLDGPLYADYVVTSNDLARLQPIGKSWLAKSQQSALEYETILELVAEQGHAYQSLIRQLNPGVDWTKVAAGTVLKIPEVTYPAPPDKAAWVVIHLSDKYLEAFGTETNLLAHFPCSIAAKVEKRPVGELHVKVIAPNPNYTFDPAIFPESPEAQAIGHKLVLPPGPNNPVGVAWIGLDKPGYGMHGTPNPEEIGRTESHGCFRLANWDAEYLLKLVWVGLPVYVEP